MSLFLLKNSFGSKMKKGFRNFCNGESSTSTLDPQKVQSYVDVSRQKPPAHYSSRETHPTLEEMILQLEMEDESRSRDQRGMDFQPHRMSCVNSSDILRTARNALNQYPRFSLDGKDSIYRSSFTSGPHKLMTKVGMIGGESVIWCKPGVVAKLMGLDAVPVPLNSISYTRERLGPIIRRQNLRKRVEKERRKLLMKRREVAGKTGYSFIKPIDLDIPSGEAGWPMKRFL